MNLIKLLILDEEVIIALAIILLILLIYILWSLWKTVVIPTITVAVSKASYLHGETVTVTGNLKENDVAVPDEEVTVAIKEPSGEVLATLEAVTDSDGNYSVEWEVPSDAVPGTYTVTATGLGTSATTTFTNSDKKMEVNTR
jgi:hypothetical protein